ncbi:MAG TPA: putative zinc-binding metallopeptidase [Terriglobia bacterium]|nr:putative zinc-binding metallopeptidase [Terriglobia bacterium]
MSLKRGWHHLADEQLLDLRLCDLPLSVEGTVMEQRIKRLYQELAGRGIRLKPHTWLSEEWFSPDGVPGIAIPFYLAHPRLMKMEREKMYQVEGGADKECMRILRHEAGHALDTAFHLHRRRQWRRLFGSFTQRYPNSYKPKASSRDHVLHLDAWYAQVHPAEDFAETFAVWLTPGSQWRRRYEGWPALEKLEYIDQLMAEIAGTVPKNKRRSKVEPLSEIKRTLREHYRRKCQYYAFEWPTSYHRELQLVFSRTPRHRTRPSAAAFLRTVSRELCRVVAEKTGVHPYTINQLLQDMIEQCRKLQLRVAVPESQARSKAIDLLKVQVMSVIHSGYYRIAV